MLNWIRELLKTPTQKKIEEQKKLLLTGLGHPWPRPEYILEPAQALLALGVSKDDVAGMLEDHTNFFDVMEFAIGLRPSLADKFGRASFESAQAHAKLCGHLDRAHWARNSISFAAKCFSRAGTFPPGFHDLRDLIFKKTSWAFPQ